MTRKELKKEVTRAYDEAVCTAQEVELDIPFPAKMKAWNWSSYGIRMELDLPTVSMQIKTWEHPRKETIKVMTDFLMMLID